MTSVLEHEPLLRPGHTNCAGCGMSIGLQWLDEVFADQRPYLVIPAACAIVTAGAFPTTSYGVPTLASTFASAPAYATGVSAVAEMNGDPHPTICWAGDGGYRNRNPPPSGSPGSTVNRASPM